MKRLIRGAVIGASMALSPLVAFAAEPVVGAAASRAVTLPIGTGTTVLATSLALAGFFLVLSLGYLYRRERSLDWEFQLPAVPHDDHADAHGRHEAAPAAANASAPHGH